MLSFIDAVDVIACVITKLLVIASKIPKLKVKNPRARFLKNCSGANCSAANCSELNTNLSHPK